MMYVSSIPESEYERKSKKTTLIETEKLLEGL